MTKPDNTSSTCNSNVFEASPEQIAHYREFGYFLTPVLFPQDTLDQIITATMERYEAAILEAEKQSPEAAASVRTRAFLIRNHLHAPIFDQFCRARPFVDLSLKMIGPDVDVFWSQAIVKPAGKGRQLAWHQDAQYGITEPLDPGITALVSLTPSTVDNGTIWILPGRHREGLLPHEKVAGTEEWEGRYDVSAKIPVEMESGQAVIFSRYLPHSSGPNTTDKVRISYQLGYCPPGITSVSSGKPFGDQLPLLRDGKPVGSP